MFDYPGAYIVVKGRISAIGKNVANRRNKMRTFKNNAPFRLSIIKINNTFIDNAEDLDIVMQMNNKLLRVRWQLFYDIRSFVELLEIWHKVNIGKTTRRKSFEYKTKIIGSTPENECRLKAEEHWNLCVIFGDSQICLPLIAK